MPNEITPQAAIIELNRIRTAKDERSASIDMAITAINRCFVKRKPEPEPRYYGIGRCPTCHVVFMDKSTNHCGNCGQALDWLGGDSDGRNKQ